MSHFSVMVIGNNVESLLAPFHEFECTGIDDKFVVDVDNTEEVKKEADEFKAKNDASDEEALQNALYYRDLEDRVVSDESDVDKGSTHKYGYAVVKDGQLVRAIKRTNPEKKWDWWVVGGRWSGHLTLKNGSAANSSTVDCIDFDKMETDAALEAAHRYDKVKAARAENSDLWDQVLALPSFEDLRKEIGAFNETADEKSKRDVHSEYWAGDRLNLNKILRDQEGIGNFFDLNEILGIEKLSREQFIKDSSVGVWLTYAAVQEDENGKPEWMSRGEMGWFGMSRDEISQGEWAEKMTKHIRGLPSDTTITIVDCHI